MRRTLMLALAAATALVAASSALAAGTPVKVEQTKALGKVIANAQGHTLYLFRADHGTTSACYGQCATYWPPLLTTAKPSAMAGVKTSLLGTTKRKDGKLQVTYKGHPLYTFVKDKDSEDTYGQDLNAFGADWYALKASGEKAGGDES